MQVDVGKNGDSRRIAVWLSIDNWWSANNNCDRPPCSLPHRRPRIMDDHNEEKRTENCTQRWCMKKSRFSINISHLISEVIGLGP